MSNPENHFEIACELLAHWPTPGHQVRVAASLDLRSGEIFNVAPIPVPPGASGDPRFFHLRPAVTKDPKTRTKNSAARYEFPRDLENILVTPHVDSESGLSLRAMDCVKIMEEVPKMKAKGYKFMTSMLTLGRGAKTADDQEFDVEITRIAPQTTTVRVKARSAMAAGVIAEDGAGDLDFAGREKESQYVLGSITPVEAPKQRRAVKP